MQQSINPPTPSQVAAWYQYLAALAAKYAATKPDDPKDRK